VLLLHDELLVLLLHVRLAAAWLREIARLAFAWLRGIRRRVGLTELNELLVLLLLDETLVLLLHVQLAAAWLRGIARLAFAWLRGISFRRAPSPLPPCELAVVVLVLSLVGLGKIHIAFYFCCTSHQESRNQMDLRSNISQLFPLHRGR